MAVRSSFFNSVNGDRRYLANNFAEYFASFIANGIFPTPSNTLQVYEKTNMTVTVKPGKGWINGYFAVNEYDYDLTLDNADGVLNRIDRIVLRLDFNARAINIAVKKGTFASTPVAPTLQRDADAHELALADVYVIKGATTIRQSNITDQRLNNALCGVVHGTVSQVDTTTIFNQYSAWFSETTGKTESEINQWQLTVKVEFDQWFASIQNILDGDVAANLAARITTLEQQFATHQADLVSHGIYGTATGTNTLTLPISNATAYVEGMLVAFKNTTTNTGATTLNINSLGAKPIKKANGNDLSSGNLKAGGIYQLRYDGSSFILLGEGGEYGTATANDVLIGKTLGTENGIVNGTYSNVKSIQRGVATFASGDTSKQVTISNIDTSKAIILISGCQTSQVMGLNTEYALAGELTNSTTITLSRTASGDTATVAWTVIEFNNVKSKQSGSYSHTGSTSTLPISSVNTAKSLLFFSYLYVSPTSSYSVYDLMMYGYLTNSTTITFGQYGASPVKTVKWQVIEFN